MQNKITKKTKAARLPVSSPHEMYNTIVISGAEDALEQCHQSYYPHYNLQDVGLPRNLPSLRQIQNLPGSSECYTLLRRHSPAQLVLHGPQLCRTEERLEEKYLF